MNSSLHSPRTKCIITAVLAIVVSYSVSPALSYSSLATPWQKSRRSEIPNLPEAQRQVGEYISSGRYDRDVAKIAASARVWLDKRARTATKPAIVLDIDETSLSNWPALKINGWVRITDGPCDLKTAPCGVRAWQAMAQSKAIAPTLALARRARDLGVETFFITGRPERLREATERNLREQGFAWKAILFRPANEDSVVAFKTAERRKITEQGYTIILNLGDQESDLKGGYAERTFKLPNPSYLVP